MQCYYVRVGSLAEIHIAEGDPALRPGCRVIVRTPRGVEVGCVVSPLRPSSSSASISARVLRPISDQDELLLMRLQRHKRQAIEACRASLLDSGSKTTLLDVDQIFDGGTLVMHFLGPVDEIAQQVTHAIVQRYESVVRSRHFAKLLQLGCGPGCGTVESAGCGSGGCSQCGLARCVKGT